MRSGVCRTVCTTMRQSVTESPTYFAGMLRDRRSSPLAGRRELFFFPRYFQETSLKSILNARHVEITGARMRNRLAMRADSLSQINNYGNVRRIDEILNAAHVAFSPPKFSPRHMGIGLYASEIRVKREGIGTFYHLSHIHRRFPASIYQPTDQDIYMPRALAYRLINKYKN